MDRISQWQSERDNFSPIKINLQLFAGEEVSNDVPVEASSDVQETAADVSEQVAVADAPKPESFAAAGDLWLQSLESATEEKQEETKEPVVQEVKEKTPEKKEPVVENQKDIINILKGMGVEKFDSPETVAKSYVEMEAYSTRMAQEKAQLQKTLIDLQAKLTQADSVKNQPASKAEEIAPVEEYDPQEDINSFYENPKAYKEAIIKETLASVKNELKQEFDQQLKPIVSQQQATKQKEAHDIGAKKFFEQYPDAESFLTPLAEQLVHDNEFNQLTDPDAVVTQMAKALTYAKGLAYKRPVTPEEVMDNLLKDQKAFDKYIYGNEEVRNKLLKKAVSDVQKDKVPPVMTKSSAAQVVTRTADKAEDFDQLGEILKKANGWI